MWSLPPVGLFAYFLMIGGPDNGNQTAPAAPRLYAAASADMVGYPTKNVLRLWYEAGPDKRLAMTFDSATTFVLFNGEEGKLADVPGWLEVNQGSSFLAMPIGPAEYGMIELRFVVDPHARLAAEIKEKTVITVEDGDLPGIAAGTYVVTPHKFGALKFERVKCKCLYCGCRDGYPCFCGAKCKCPKCRGMTYAKGYERVKEYDAILKLAVGVTAKTGEYQAPPMPGVRAGVYRWYRHNGVPVIDTAPVAKTCPCCP